MQTSHLRRAAPAIVFSAWLAATGCGGGAHSDQALTNQIQAKLYSDPATKGSNVGVAVHNGAVTLSGDVGDPNVALEAMKIANGTTGVKSVDDKLTVNGAAASQIPGAQSAASAAQTQAPPPPPMQAQAPPPAASAAPAPPARPAEVTVPAGTRIQVRTIDAIDSSHATVGQTYSASLEAPIVHGRRVVIPAGANATILLANAQRAGRIKGNNELELRLTRIEYLHRWYDVDTSVYAAEGKSKGKQTAVRTGIGAAAGAVIGALAGHGKGAAIGSAIGAGGGLGVNMLTHGPQVKIPSETVLTFRLEQPLTVQE